MYEHLWQGVAGKIEKGEQSWQAAIRELKEETGLDIKTSDAACKEQKILDLVQKCVNETNSKLVSKAAHIKKFLLLPVDFSMPGGELTPTMKLKRKVTEKKYQKEID